MIDPITCIILAGGLGTRLRSVVSDRPKCLAPIGGKSFLEIQMNALATRGIEKFVLSLGYMSEVVVDAISDFEIKYDIQYVIEKTPLGTGGAVLNILDIISHQEILVTNGDTWLDAPLDAMFNNLNLKSNELMRLASVAVPDRSRYGGLLLSGEIVRGFEPKGSNGPGLINAGLYRLHKDIFFGKKIGESFSLEADIMPSLVDKSSITAKELNAKFIDIGIPEDYEKFCNLQLNFK